ncbi:22746_t:CDS:2, partial [Racocetra persica]
EEEEEEDFAERKIMLDSFTKQTNALDVDKHMMAYIEEEMRKRRGQSSDSKNDVEDAEHADPLNPQDELFQAPDHLR